MTIHKTIHSEDFKAVTPLEAKGILKTAFKKTYPNLDPDKIYITEFNTKPSMRRDTFNRSAQQYLVPLFIAKSLKLNKTAIRNLTAAFLKEAKKPWDGQIAPFTLEESKTILADMDETIKEHIWNPDNHHDGSPEFPTREAA